MGRDEASFWRQTPASFAAICRAERRRRQDEIEVQVVLNHMAAEMNAVASVGKLRPSDDYLARVRPRKRGVASMLATLQDAAARSRAITIRKVEG